MKMSLNLVLTAIAFVATSLSSHAADPISAADAFARIQAFQLPEHIEFSGKEQSRKKCDITVRLDSYSFSTTGVKWITSDGVENASMSLYASSGVSEEITDLKIQGSATQDGSIELKTRETVEAHRTDFGWHVMKYFVDHKTKLEFKDGELVSATVTTTRPFPSSLVMDPDFSGGKVENCSR
jgi:hypothetical protein